MRAVDLFCGGGGFSDGAIRAGIDVPLAYDINPVLTSSFSKNFPHTQLKLGDIAELSGSAILEAAGEPIDGLFGGPPCQGFSLIGRRDVKDPRRLLLGHFFRLVNEIRPTFFVMENVVGLNQGQAKTVLCDALNYVPDFYDVLAPIILDASDFGAATKRKRLFVIGVNTYRSEKFPKEALDKYKRPAVTVKDAIWDLANASFIGEDDSGMDLWRTTYEGGASEYAKSLRTEDQCFTGHRRTLHTKTVIKRFRTVKPGAVDPIGRYPRLEWSATCPTLRAGTGPDKGSHQSVRPIHPTEPRVITVREAARLQGFADRHIFHATIWHSFRMIGNSVCPFVAEAIFRAIAERCEAMLPTQISMRNASHRPN